MTKKYFVSFGTINEGSHQYSLNSMEITTLESEVANLSPGMLAEYLESEVSDQTENISVVILNFWEI